MKLSDDVKLYLQDLISKSVTAEDAEAAAFYAQAMYTAMKAYGTAIGIEAQLAMNFTASPKRLSVKGEKSGEEGSGTSKN